MNEKELFTGFWEHETGTMRKVLERIPEGSDYKPDERSRTAKEIAWQIVAEEQMIMDALETGKVNWNPPPMPATMKEVVDRYVEQSNNIIDRWKALPEEKWNGTLEF